MAVTERQWCDFVIYTKEEISIERISFDKQFWTEKLLPKLIDCCLAQEIISPVHLIGMEV